ncbi:MAG: hypothetical protein H7X97_05670 [Opitutaceae bacterium]|nr:hypothetical protein [Verrucomicrobiales bacterium]
MMSNSATGSKLSDLQGFAGDFAPMFEQLGSPAGLAAVTGGPFGIGLNQVSNLAELRSFLETYRDQILVPVEWPATIQACEHATRGEVRELIALDRRLDEAHGNMPFAEASRRAGRIQLKRLRPLRDNRVVQRYLKALDSGDATGWHTIVYGVMLSLYSIPLRQGLLHYATQTQASLIQSAGRCFKITDEDRTALLDQINVGIISRIETVLGPQSGPTLKIA